MQEQFEINAQPRIQSNDNTNPNGNTNRHTYGRIKAYKERYLLKGIEFLVGYFDD